MQSSRSPAMPWAQSHDNGWWRGGENRRSRGPAELKGCSPEEDAPWGGGGWNHRSRGEKTSWDTGSWQNNAQEWNASGETGWSTKRDDAQVNWKTKLGDGRDLRKPLHAHYDPHAPSPRQTAAAAVADAPQHAPQQPQQSPQQPAAAASASAPPQRQESPLQTAAAAVADNAVQPKPSPPQLASTSSLYTQVGVTH